jgi:hypothetical protein
LDLNERLYTPKAIKGIILKGFVTGCKDIDSVVVMHESKYKAMLENTPTPV